MRFDTTGLSSLVRSVSGSLSKGWSGRIRVIGHLRISQLVRIVESVIEGREKRFQPFDGRPQSVGISIVETAVRAK
jgi:hypothetical protein